MSDSKDTNEENMAVLSNFDQTNGVIEGLEGESDGTAQGEESSDADRDLSKVDAVSTGQSGGTPADHIGDDGLPDPRP